MIDNQIIDNTIAALEDTIKYYIEMQDSPELREKLGEVQTLLNFWQTYKLIGCLKMP